MVSEFPGDERGRKLTRNEAQYWIGKESNMLVNTCIICMCFKGTICTLSKNEYTIRGRYKGQFFFLLHSLCMLVDILGGSNLANILHSLIL